MCAHGMRDRGGHARAVFAAAAGASSPRLLKSAGTAALAAEGTRHETVSRPRSPPSSDTGTWQENRTGIRTISKPGDECLRFDLQQGFPAVTTEETCVQRAAIGEHDRLSARIAQRGRFPRALGCKVWGRQRERGTAQWLANPYRQGVDDLGDVYGVQWRQLAGLQGARRARGRAARRRAAPRFPDRSRASTRIARQKVLLYKAIDQLRQLSRHDHGESPPNRRILFHAWNHGRPRPDRAGPPAHLLYLSLPNVAKREILAVPGISQQRPSGSARRST
ncbi:thymidylate synthase [Burkholderia multivorans]|uniref:thymidylate synthase n=1 Tax=Burkholderia multivorans TaxID=87883 RepID=UPI003BB1D150